MADSPHLAPEPDPRARSSPVEGAGRFYAPDLSYVHHVGFGSFAEGAAPWIRGLLGEANLEGLVIELGCGSGILARAMIEAGYQVIGVDVSAGMLEIARSIAPAAHFYQASLHDFHLRPCAAVIAIGEGLSYGTHGIAELERLFARIGESVEAGGLLIFDLVLRGEGVGQNYHSERSGEGWKVEVDVEEDPLSATIVRRIRTTREVDGTSHSVDETHEVRTFDQKEVERTLGDAGFRVTTAGGYGSQALPSNRLAFFATRL